MLQAQAKEPRKIKNSKIIYSKKRERTNRDEGFINFLSCVLCRKPSSLLSYEIVSKNFTFVHVFWSWEFPKDLSKWCEPKSSTEGLPYLGSNYKHLKRLHKAPFAHPTDSCREFLMVVKRSHSKPIISTMASQCFIFKCHVPAFLT